MDFNLISNIESCHIIVPHLLYFSHIPSAIVAFLLGFFVYFKNKNAPTGKILFFTSLTFSLWAVLDLSLWLTFDSRNVMFVWSIINLVEMLVSSSVLYFSYVFLEKKDAPLKYKIIIGALLTVFVVLIPTQLNLPGFDLLNCEAEQGPLIYYFYFLETLFFLWLAVYLIKKIVTSRRTERTMAIYFSIGAICFLASFSGANILGSITEQWKILQYGLFGMPFFMAFLVYLIVQYKAFNIKLIGSQALVFALVILTGSQFFFVQNQTNKILTAITLGLATFFGLLLVKGVVREIKQKEQLNQFVKDLANANNELEIAYSKLETLDKTKSDFISIASHQLRTPLTAIKGYVSMFLEGDYGKLNGKAKKSMGNIFQANERLIGLVNSLLDLSRIEAGKIKLEPSKVDLKTMLENMVADFSSRIANRKIKLIFESQPANIPAIQADEKKIREVFSNLIDNAIKYTKEGSIKVELKAIHPYLRITIADTGIGMAPEEINGLFHSFSRGKEGKTMWVEGAGLGLYVAKKFVEMHRGRIWAESPGKGKGSKFIVELPISQ
ncbi:MAG: ATP-binding protein [Candidatus Pacebacteria bacterium]|nr:ATP-binding protein [Candidatus Paceibacterota bacterium]